MRHTMVVHKLYQNNSRDIWEILSPSPDLLRYKISLFKYHDLTDILIMSNQWNHQFWWWPGTRNWQANPDKWWHSLAIHTFAPYILIALVIRHLDEIPLGAKSSGGWINIKISPYQYRKSYCGDNRSYDRLISTMGFPILIRWHL